MSLEERIEQMLSPQRLLARFISSQAAEEGIVLSPTKIKNIQRRAFNQQGLLNEGGLIKSIKLIPGINDQESLDKVMAQLFTYLQDETNTDTITKAVTEVIHTETSTYLSGIKKRAVGRSRESRLELKRFDKEIKAIWGEALSSLSLLIETCEQAGSAANEAYHSRATEDLLFNVLDYLQSRACQVANEIFVLLKAGYADGAQARWRSIDEMAVLGYFIKSHGPEMAERFMDHSHITNYKHAHSFNQHTNKASADHYSDLEVAIITAEYDRIKDKYKHETNRKGEPTFLEDYGWARYINDKGVLVACPNFRKLEELVSLQHLRPYYRLACDNVHASSARMFYSLGTGPDHVGPVLHTGPSVEGLSSPLHGAAISLSQITGCLLDHEITLSNAITINAIAKLVDDVRQACLNAEEHL